jgi:ABC-type multidrug transport system ATPase subunit
MGTENMENTEVIITNVSKSYGRNNALNNVTLNINEGMFGLLGNNGAGKSTLMSLITTLDEPSKGQITVDGYDVTKNKLEVRKSIGYLPQNFTIYPQLTAYEFLDHILMLNHYQKSKKRKELIHTVLEKVNLFDDKHKKVAGFSGGMLRRLGIAQAIVKDPKILIVDEPTAGLDPEERIRFRTMLFELSQQKIVILSTHIVEDISASCEQMCFLDKGEIKYVDSPIDFIGNVEGYVFEKCVNNRNELISIKEKHTVISMKQMRKGTIVRIIGEDMAENDSTQKVEPNLEDAYIYYLEQLRKEEEHGASHLGNRDIGV